MLSLIPFALLASFSYANPISPQAAQAGSAQAGGAPGKPASEGTTSFDGQALAAIPAAPAPAAVMAEAIGNAGWTVTVSSEQAENPGTNAIDGDMGTIWHTKFNPTVDGFPHTFTLNMQQTYLIGSITYNPRQDGGLNGNIGQHTIQVSTDGTNFATVAYGTYQDNNKLKTTTFQPVQASYVRIIAESEAGNRGPWTSVADFSVYTAGQAAPPAAGAGKGVWTETVDFPVVPVSAILEYPTGKLLVFSSYDPSTFGGSNGAQTITALYDPASHLVVPTLVTNTGHDMFCEGLSLDFNGRAVATGGNTDAATSILDSGSNTWSTGARMNTPRGYQSQATTSDGNVFIIGASWSGGQGGKNGELYNVGANTMTLLGGAAVAPMLTGDAQGVYRADNHAMLFGWKNGYVFQAGPSVAMNWYGTANGGSQAPAGDRTGDGDSMCGVAAMYDAVAGKILKVGGSEDYQNSNANTNAYVITLVNDPPALPQVQKIQNVAYQRAFANSVVMPDGKVFITGGQVYANPFSDDTAQYTPEIFDPATNTFAQLATQAIPRTYHSVALLMPDATIMSGGGGLCGDCATNHYDAQLFNPPYLYTATGALAARPGITAAPGTIAVGATFTVTTDVGVNGFSLIRFGSTTHTVNTDQRRIPLTPSATAGNTYTLTVPNNPGIALPGPYMLFVLNNGVPSVSKMIKITP